MRIFKKVSTRGSVHYSTSYYISISINNALKQAFATSNRSNIQKDLRDSTITNQRFFCRTECGRLFVPILLILVTGYWDLNQFGRAIWFTSNYILREQIALPERLTIYWRQLVPESPIRQYAIPSATATSHSSSLYSVSPLLFLTKSTRLSRFPSFYLTNIKWFSALASANSIGDTVDTIE